MIDIIESYHRDIDRMMQRIKEIDRAMATMPMSTVRAQLADRRVSLMLMVREAQRDIADMLDRAPQ